jgi:hypothetical protein
MAPPLPHPAVNTDRNLLFGILAFQNALLTREALVAGMQAWLYDKGKPLGQILVEQGALGSDEHALLEALVQKHLQRHGNDPVQSLAAVSSLGSVRQQLNGIADPDLHACLAHVSAARPPDDDPYATRAGAWTGWAGGSALPHPAAARSRRPGRGVRG